MIFVRVIAFGTEGLQQSTESASSEDANAPAEHVASLLRVSADAGAAAAVLVTEPVGPQGQAIYFFQPSLFSSGVGVAAAAETVVAAAAEAVVVVVAVAAAAAAAAAAVAAAAVVSSSVPSVRPSPLPFASGSVDARAAP